MKHWFADHFNWVRVLPTDLRFQAGLLIAAGCGLRLHNLGNRQLWLDELIQLGRFSKGDLLQCILDLRSEIAAAPLDYVVQRCFMKIVGEGEVAARLHAALFGCVSLAVFYWICRRVLPPKTAVAALFLLSCNPLHHWYSQEGRNYSLLFLLTLCGFATILRALKTGGTRPWVLFAIVSTLSLYTNYLAITVLMAQFAFAAIRTGVLRNGARSPEDPLPRRPLKPLFASVAVAILAFSPWLIFTYNSARGGAPETYLGGGLWLRIVKEISGGGYPLSLLLLTLFVFGAASLWAAEEREGLVLLLVWLLVPITTVLTLVKLRDYAFSIRQTLVALPALVMGASMGVSWLKAQFPTGFRRQAQTSLILLLGTISLSAIYLHSGKEEADWRHLTEELSSVEESKVTAPDIELPLSYLAPWLEEKSIPFEEMVDALERCGDSTESLILVESRYMASSRKSTILALRRSGKISSTTRFNGFEIHRLRCPGTSQ